jgi:hypothetical protein
MAKLDKLNAGDILKSPVYGQALVAQPAQQMPVRVIDVDATTRKVYASVNRTAPRWFPERVVEGWTPASA